MKNTVAAIRMIAMKDTVTAIRKVLCQRMWEKGRQSGEPRCNGESIVCGECDVTARRLMDVISKTQIPMTDSEQKAHDLLALASPDPVELENGEYECGGFGCTTDGCPGHYDGNVIALNIGDLRFVFDRYDRGDEYSKEELGKAEAELTLLAFARNNLPALLDEIEQLRRENVDLRGRLDRMENGSQ